MRFKCKICDYVLELKHIRHFVELHPEAVKRFNDANQKFYDEILDDGIFDEDPIILDADTERRLNDWNKNLTCTMTKHEWNKFEAAEDRFREYEKNGLHRHSQNNYQRIRTSMRWF